MAGLVRGAHPADYLPAAGIAAVAGVGALLAAITLTARRESDPCGPALTNHHLRPARKYVR